MGNPIASSNTVQHLERSCLLHRKQTAERFCQARVFLNNIIEDTFTVIEKVVELRCIYEVCSKANTYVQVLNIVTQEQFATHNDPSTLEKGV